MSATSPGWYPDPQNPAIIRFYDGKEWTNETAPAPANGQLSPEIIARGHQIMATRSGRSAASASVAGSPPEGAGSPAGTNVGSSSTVSQPYSGFTTDGGVNDAAADRKTPGWVWPAIGVAALASLGVVLVAPALLSDSGGSTGGSDSETYVAASDMTDDYASLELTNSYTCDDLFDELFLGGTFEDTNGEAVVGASGPRLVEDARADFELPTDPEDYSLIFTCSGTAEYADGETKNAQFELSSSSDRNLWVVIDPR